MAIVAVALGIDDNPPGVLTSFLAAISFVLAFSHHWRTTKQFGVLLLASVVGFVLFIILNMISDSITQNPEAPIGLQNLIQSPAYEALSLIFAMICPAAFVVGAGGLIAGFIRSRRHPQ